MLNLFLGMSQAVIYKESLVRGFGNEFLFTSAFVGFFLFVALYIIFKYYSTGGGFREYVVDSDDEAPRVYNMDETCTICLNEQRLSVETNCGHIFCGICLKNLYYHNTSQIMSCPICRELITMVFVYFTDNERNTSDPDLISSRTAICNFVIYYNRRFSGGTRTISEYITELPVLLRHLWSDLFSGHGLLRNQIRIRILVFLLFAGLYLLLPTDVIPEAMFGVLGLIDDILVISVILLYLCRLYRNVVASGDINTQSFNFFS